MFRGPHPRRSWRLAGALLAVLSLPGPLAPGRLPHVVGHVTSEQQALGETVLTATSSGVAGTLLQLGELLERPLAFEATHRYRHVAGRLLRVNRAKPCDELGSFLGPEDYVCGESGRALFILPRANVDRENSPLTRQLQRMPLDGLSLATGFDRILVFLGGPSVLHVASPKDGKPRPLPLIGTTPRGLSALSTRDALTKIVDADGFSGWAFTYTDGSMGRDQLSATLALFSFRTKKVEIRSFSIPIR